MIELTLPMPPSTNNLYANAPGKGRVKTERYESWWRAAGNHILAQRGGLERIAGPYQMCIRLSAKSRHPLADVGNRIKAVEDLCVAMYLIDDDRKAENVAIGWDDDVPAKQCKVYILPWTAERKAMLQAARATEVKEPA